MHGRRKENRRDRKRREELRRPGCTHSHPFYDGGGLSYLRGRGAVHARGSSRSQLVHREADRGHQGQAYAGTLQCIILLSRREISESLEALIEALKDEEYLVKSNAMVAISAYGKQVSDRIIEALSDADKDIRAGAAWIIGEIKDIRAIEALEKVAKDDYPLARIQAKASLVAMGKGKKKQEDKPEEPEETKSE